MSMTDGDQLTDKQIRYLKILVVTDTSHSKNGQLNHELENILEVLIRVYTSLGIPGRISVFLEKYRRHYKIMKDG